MQGPWAVLALYVATAAAINGLDAATGDCACADGKGMGRICDRLFVGGPTTLRGFEPCGIGPRAPRLTSRSRLQYGCYAVHLRYSVGKGRSSLYRRLTWYLEVPKNKRFIALW